MKHLLSVAAAAGLLAFCSACAQGDPQTDLDRVQQRVAKVIPELKKENVHPTVTDDLFEVQLGPMYGYVTADGKYLIQGDLVNIETGEEITENRRRGYRLQRLTELGVDNMIVFAPEHAKHTVTVFTDVDCGYCRKLHSEIAEYNAQGIAVRYVFYPRAGLGSDSYRKAEAVWCAADRKSALTQAKLGAPLQGATADCPNPVAREWQLGQDLGLRGTPMLVLEDGEVVNGYVPPQQLAMRLDAPPQQDHLK